MKMTSRFLAGVFVAVAIQGGASFAETLDFSLKLGYDPSHYSNGVGGEFQAYSVNGLPFANQAAGVQLAANTFQTFCVEYTEEFVPGTTLYAQINDAARFGGAGGASADPSHPGMTYDPLDDRTAFLYTKFSTGALSGYNYTSGAGRSATAGQLQKAIWFLENEIPSLGAGDTLALSWVSLANTAVAAGGEWFGMGIGNVRVLNLWTDATHQDWDHRAQDQLVMVDAPPQIATPLPGVATAGLVLMGGLALKKRRRPAAAHLQ